MKQHNPNSFKLPRRRGSSNTWSELPQDLLNSVFERLGFADSRRAQSVCSSWYSVARKWVAKKHTPWLILLPDEDDKMNNHSCTLFNPEEKEKLYKMRYEDVEFRNSYFLATYGTWLLMIDRCYNLYLLNLFTHERIDLPSVESQHGTIKLERTLKGWLCISNDHHERIGKHICIELPVFWIDEHTKEYIVFWVFYKYEGCVVYSKKGDKFWSQIQVRVLYGRSHMVYKDHKLYYLLNNYFGGSGFIKIFDFSGETPQETFQCGLPSNISSLYLTGKLWSFTGAKLVVTVTGDVLKVEKWLRPGTSLSSFRVYKVYSSGVFKNYKQVDSLGHEAMLFDLASLCSLMMAFWVLREIPSTMNPDRIGFVLITTLLKFVSSISRQRRWSHCTSLIVRPHDKLAELDGSYQVSSRHNSPKLCCFIFLWFAKILFYNITTVMVYVVWLFWNIKYNKNLFWLFGKFR